MIPSYIKKMEAQGSATPALQLSPALNDPTVELKSRKETDSSQKEIATKVETLSKTLREQGRNLVDLSHTPTNCNVDQLIEFVEKVFHGGVLEDAECLFYAPRSNQPRSPLKGEVKGLRKKLERATHGHALYFCMSSMLPDKNGRYSHKRDQFSAMHCVVLDDIGTKISLEKLPSNLQAPSYIIETSKENYQYGYILNNAIEDIEHASGLVQVMALAGLTDSGGCMPTKLVRLPDGYNGKRDPSLDKGLFHVRLVELNDNIFTPEDLVECAALEINGNVVTWRAILDGYSPTSARTKARYMPIQPNYYSAGGVVDPVLEWLYKNDRVVSDHGGDWITIKCHHGHNHTTGDDTSGYKPLGRGSEPHKRYWNCFHETCASEHTKDFLGYVLVNSDFPYIGYEDLSIPLLTDYIFDEQQNAVWRTKEGEPTTCRTLDGFKNKNNQKGLVLAMGASGKLAGRYITAAQQWMENPFRIAAVSSTHAAGEAPMIRSKHGDLTLNSYRPPPWGKGSFSQYHVDRFNSFISYLLPNKSERNYFMQWLAAKVQRPQHRGTAIVMVAEAYGVGRSTLALMLGELFGIYNSATVGFEELVKAGGFNHWEDKDFVVVSEAEDTSSYLEAKGARKAYECLKQRVDTTAVKTTLNVKYMKHREITVTSSYLILTNHEGAIAIPEDDRRFSVMRNPAVPECASYFKAHNQWTSEKNNDNEPIWAGDVYRWLHTVKVDFTSLQLPLRTDAKRTMVLQSLAPPERITALIADYAINNKHYFAITSQLVDYIRQALINDDPDIADRYNNQRILKAIADVTLNFPNYKLRWNDKGATSVRVFKQALQKGHLPVEVDGDRNKKANKLPRELKSEIEKSTKTWNKDDLLEHIAENM